jgi:hypothetical protein
MLDIASRAVESIAAGRNRQHSRAQKNNFHYKLTHFDNTSFVMFTSKFHSRIRAGRKDYAQSRAIIKFQRAAAGAVHEMLLFDMQRHADKSRRGGAPAGASTPRWMKGFSFSGSHLIPIHVSCRQISPDLNWNILARGFNL